MSISSSFLWRFLEDVWDILPTEDRELFQAYWSGLLQTGADLEQKTIEAALSTQVSTVPVYLTERWNRFVMNDETCDLFSQTDVITLSGTASFAISRETAFYETLKVSTASGQIQHSETMKFFDDAVRELRYDKIVPGTLSVSLGSFEYVPNRDYAVNYAAGTIQALDDGVIPPTEILTIKYQHEEYKRDLDYDVDELQHTISRTASSAIPDPTAVTVTYTYNGTATLGMVGTNAGVDTTTLTDENQDFSTLIPGRTLTILSGPNAGTYTITSVLSPTQLAVAELFPLVQETAIDYSINAFPHGVRVNSAIASIPTLQNRVDAPDTFMIEGIDYRVDAGILSMRAPFPLSELGPSEDREHELWAEVTKLDRETPYRNFGVLIDFYRENSEAYKLALQGLWYTFWTGSTPGNLERGLHILLGLPFARRAGTVTRVDPTLGEIDITEASGRVITYSIPDGLDATVSRGDEVARFDRLTTGVDIIDKNNHPGFVADILGRTGIQSFLTDNATTGLGNTDETKALLLLEEHLFVPQILVEAVSQIINVVELKTFLDNLKPAWTEYVFSFAVSESETVYLSGDPDDGSAWLNTDEVVELDMALDLTSAVQSNTWNQAFGWNLHRIESGGSGALVIVRRFDGATLGGGSQATGNFQGGSIDFVDLGIDEGDVVFMPSGPHPGHWNVIKRISSGVLSLDIPDVDLLAGSSLEFIVAPYERRMDNDVPVLGNEHLLFVGADFPAPTTLNTKTDIDFASTDLRNEEVKALLLVDAGNVGNEVQPITDADVVLNEFDVSVAPGTVTRAHEISSASLYRYDNAGMSVTDVFAI